MARDAAGPIESQRDERSCRPDCLASMAPRNLALQLFKVHLSKGKNFLTVHILTNGNMNLAYFDFKAVHE